MSLFGNTGGSNLFGTPTPASTTAAPLFGAAPGINLLLLYQFCMISFYSNLYIFYNFSNVLNIRF